MREIKFRGKDIQTGLWHFGYYSYSYSFKEHWISEKVSDTIHPMEISYSVLPETVGQYTGLKDKLGNDIYEFDILTFKTSSVMGFQENGKLFTFPPVEFGRFNAKDSVLYNYVGFHIDGCSIEYKLSHGCEIAGNKFDNKELLNT